MEAVVHNMHTHACTHAHEITEAFIYHAGWVFMHYQEEINEQIYTEWSDGKSPPRFCVHVNTFLKCFGDECFSAIC